MLSRFSIIFAALALPVLALSPGDKVTLDAIGKADFLQGKPPASWKKGELYILECWATWCGPCVAVIPHVDALYDQYKDQGLNVIGMNVWEDGKDKVAGFLEDKGDGMSYPVAYVGKGGQFEEKWLKAAGVRGIPHAFVVMDGKYLFSTHPANLKEETIKELLAGGDKAAEVVSQIQQAEANKGAVQEQMQAFQAASQAGDTTAMENAIKKIEELDSGSAYLGRMKADLAVAKKDWEGATTMLTAMDDARDATMAALGILMATDESTEEPPAALLKVIAAKLGESPMDNPSIKAARARAQWKAGLKDEARATAQAAAADPGRYPKEALESFAASFETEKPLTLKELFESFRAGQ